MTKSFVLGAATRKARQSEWVDWLVCGKNQLDGMRRIRPSAPSPAFQLGRRKHPAIGNVVGHGIICSVRQIGKAILRQPGVQIGE